VKKQILNPKIWKAHLNTSIITNGYINIFSEIVEMQTYFLTYLKRMVSSFVMF